MTPEEEKISRDVNRCTGGHPDQLFCARTYALRYTSLRWFLVWCALDRWFWIDRRERWHCRNRWLEDCDRIRREEADAIINIPWTIPPD